MRTRIMLLSVAVMLSCCSIQAWASLLGYNVTQDIAAGPPYPADPISFDVFHAPPNQVPYAIHGLNIQMYNVTNFNGVVISALGSDDGFGDPPGLTAMVDFLHPTEINGLTHVFFDLLFEFPSSPGHPQFIGPPVIQDNDGGFELLYGVFVPGVGRAFHTAHFGLNPDQALRFENVRVSENQNPGIHVLFDLFADEDLDEDLLFSIEQTGKFQPIPEPTTLVLGLLAFGTLALRRCRRS